MMGEVMGEDADQDNKQQNPDEEPTIDEGQPEEEPQTLAPEETVESASESEESVEPESKTEESDNTEEESSNESEQSSSDDESFDSKDNEAAGTEGEAEKETPSEKPETEEESSETPDKEEQQEEDVAAEPEETGVEEEISSEPEPGQVTEPEAEVHEESEAESINESEAPMNSEEAEEELLAGMPPNTMVEKEETDTDVAAMEAEGSHAEHTVNTDSDSHHAPVVVIVALLVGLLMVTVAFMAYQSTKDSTVEDATSQVTEDELGNEDVAERVVMNEAQAKLEDVTTGGVATGTASAKYYDDGAYELATSFTGLPNVTNGEFFEGWLVNQTTEEFISTGAVEYTSDGQVVNNFSGSQDYQTQGYTFYVLTLEPNDNNPAPATHVLEGTLETVN